MLLASCTPDAVVCDDTPMPPLDWALLVVEVLAVVLLVVAVLYLWTRRPRRPERRPTRIVYVDAGGDVVRRR